MKTSKHFILWILWILPLMVGLGEFVSPGWFQDNDTIITLDNDNPWLSRNLQDEHLNGDLKFSRNSMAGASRGAGWIGAIAQPLFFTKRCELWCSIILKLCYAYQRRLDSVFHMQNQLCPMTHAIDISHTCTCSCWICGDIEHENNHGSI